MKPRGTYQTTAFRNPNKTKSYRVTGTKPDGVRVRENYKTEHEALARKQQLEVEAHNFIPEKSITTTRLTPAQEADAERAYAELGSYPLLFVVRFFNENYREPVKKITVAKAYEEFTAAKKASGLRDASVKALKCRVGFLNKLCPDKLVSDILPSHVAAAISQPGITEGSRQDNRRSLSSFFSWCIDREYCQTNPAKKTSRTRGTKDDAEPEILSLAEIRRLLAAASTFKGGKLVPYVALSLFTGIRPTELARLSWDDIDLDASSVTVGAKIAKMRQRRIIEFVELTDHDRDKREIKLPANLRDWLLPHATDKTPLRGKNWRRDFDALKLAVGFGNPDQPRRRTESAAEKARRRQLKPWTQDMLRHTGISQHLAYLQHEGRTAAWAGNSPDIIQRHYKGLVKAADSKTFWSLRPEPVGEKVITLPAPEAAAKSIASKIPTA